MGRILSPASPLSPELAVSVPVRVLIVDDSPTMRRLIRTGLETDRRIQVVGEAGNAREARDAVKGLEPDVMTLDVEMPGLDGLQFLERLMRARPMPVVMFSSVTPRGSDAALRALSLGAVDCLEKPRFGSAERTFAHLAETLLVAASARISHTRAGDRDGGTPADLSSWRWNGKWVLIGASTGGVEAIETILAGMPANGPPVLVTQHMPAPFLASFAHRLDLAFAPSVRLASDGDRPARGQVFLAPGGDTHLVLDADGQTLRLLAAPKRSGHRPSVDMMFASAVPHARRMVAAILTGMGRDGAEQMRVLRDNGALCIGQDRDTSVIYGMPRAARDAGAVDVELPLERIAASLLRHTGANHST